MRFALRVISLVVAAALLPRLGARAFADTWIHEDCEPKRACDATRDCSLQEDKRDCSLQVDTRSCGHDVHYNDPACEAAKAITRDGRSCGHDAHINDPACEAAKAAQNVAYKAAHDACEAGKASQNALYVAAKAQCESLKASEKATCEATKTNERFQCETGLRGPFSCNSGGVIEKLRMDKQGPVRGEWTGIATTPLSVASTHWRSTTCSASGVGRVYQRPQHSSDGFWTVDVELISFEVGGVQKPAGTRFIRLEVKPRFFGGGKAHDFFDTQSLSVDERVKFEGPVYIDKDGPFLEVHPGDVFEKVR